MLLLCSQRLETVDEVVRRADVSSTMMQEKVGPGMSGCSLPAA